MELELVRNPLAPSSVNANDSDDYHQHCFIHSYAKVNLVT